MPLRGESVGTAYIKLIADGTGIPDDIRDSFDSGDANRAYDDAGRKGAKTYHKAFADELDRHAKDNTNSAFFRSLAKNDALEKFFTDDGWSQFEHNVKQRFGEQGTIAAQQIREKFTRGGSLDGILRDMENVTGRINANLDKAVAENTRAMGDFERNFRRVMEESSSISQKVSRDNVGNLESVRRTLENMASTVRGAGRDLDTTGTTVDRLTKKLKASTSEVDKNRNVFGRLGQVIDHIALTTGRAFGKGSRNNFVNFTGSFVQGATSLLGIVPKVLDNITQFGTGFKTALNAGEGFFKAMTSGFAEMGKDAEGASTALSESFGAIIVAGPAVVAALLGVVGILSIVAALASGVAAAIIALAGSLSFALVGAIVPLVGLLGPVAIGIAATVAGVISLTQHSKELKAEFKPLIDDFKELGNQARTGFLKTFSIDAKQLSEDLKPLQNTFHNIGESVGTLGTQLLKSFDSKTAERFFRVMGDFAPEVVTKLGTAVGNVLGAFADIFVDSVPQARTFLDWLNRITNKFQEWVHTNPKTIKDFFQSAADSLKAVGQFAGPLTRLIGTLLGGGRKSGDDIFKSLGDNIDKFNKFLKEHPDGLNDFFKNGEQVAKDIGSIAVSIGKIFDALDSPEGRKNLHDLLDLLSKIAALAGPLDFLANTVIPLLMHALIPGSGTVDGLSRIAGAIRGIGDGIRHVGDVIGDHNPFDAIGRAVSNIHLPSLDGIRKRITSFFSGLNLGGGGANVLAIRPPSLAWIPGVLGRIGNFFSAIGNAASRVDFGGLTSAAAHAATRVGGFFAALPGRLAGLAGRFGGAAAQWAANILSEVSDVPGEIVDMFRGLASEIVSAIGTITPHISIPPITIKGHTIFPGISTASGGIFDGEQLRIIGEAGAEAVVPLTGPLSAVDPSVRELSAIARGLRGSSSQSSSVQTMPGKTVNVEQHITTVAVDPLAAASEMLNYLTAAVA